MKKKKTNKIVIAALIVVVLIVAVLGFIAKRSIDREVIEEAGSSDYAERKATEIVYKGQAYPLKKHINTVLIVGTDSRGDEKELPPGVVPFYNKIQADVIFLLVIDNDEKTARAIQINRDTMVDDPWLDVLGNYGGTKFEQIALSYNSGSGKLDSCKNTALAVSTLLFGLPIDNCFAFNMTGIGTMNDLVGGVTVTLEDDMTSIAPELTRGKTVRLNGKQAESFVRARSSLPDDTNSARMRRHRSYLDGFLDSAHIALEEDGEFIMKALERLQPFMITDMSAEKLADTAQKTDEYGLTSLEVPDGELRLGQYYEFYVDEESLWAIVSELCCE